MESHEHPSVKVHIFKIGNLMKDEEDITERRRLESILLDKGNFQTTMQNLKENDILNYNDFPVKTKSGQRINTDIYLVDRATLAQFNIRDIIKRNVSMPYVRNRFWDRSE